MSKITSGLFSWLVYGLALLIPIVLGWLVWDIVRLGWSSVSWTFIITEPVNSGRSGGILPILLSTSWILAIALVAAIPLGLGTAIWLAEYQNQGSTTRRSRWIRLCLDTLAGVPSIVFGLFGYAFFCVYLGFGYSILAGGLTLACMILPLFIRICESGLRAVSSDWRRAGAALGMSHARVLWSVLLPAATPALIAGLMLSIGRASAETAALLFTSGYVSRSPEGVLDSGRALSVHIYDLTMNVTGGNSAAYATAFVLMLLIILIHGITLLLSHVWLKKQGFML